MIDAMGSILPFGAHPVAEGMNFSLAVSKGTQVEIALYIAGTSTCVVREKMHKVSVRGDIYTLWMKKMDWKNYDYSFFVDGEAVRDPYARLVRSRENLRYGFLKSFDWKDDVLLQIPYEELYIYKLHVRGLTKHPFSKVRHKGTFRGVIEKIPYLKSLGINGVELMPVVAFDEKIKNEKQQNKIPDYARKQAVKSAQDALEETVEEVADEQTRINYWGYGPADYFAVQPLYSENVHPDTSFKEMILEFHKNTIEVYMEMVFEPGTSQHFIVECLRMWILEYHVDGFHLNEDVVQMQEVITDPVIGSVKLMCAGFDEGLLKKTVSKEKVCANYNMGFLMTMRRFLKGDEGMLENFIYHVKDNERARGSIHYMANHNGFTLMDMVSYNQKNNIANGEDNEDGMSCNESWNCGVEGVTRRRNILKLRRQQLRNAFMLTIFSQGTPLIYAGDEFGHSKQGNNNAYCQDNEVNWLNWKDLKKNQKLFDFVRKIIEIRKSHPILSKAQPFRMMDYSACGYPDLSFHGLRPWYPDFSEQSRSIGLMYCGLYEKIKEGTDDFFYFAYNMHWNPQVFALPVLPKKMKWYPVIDTSKEDGIGDEQEVPDMKKYTVSGRSIVLFVGKNPASDEIKNTDAGEEKTRPETKDQENLSS